MCPSKYGDSALRTEKVKEREVWGEPTLHVFPMQLVFVSCAMVQCVYFSVNTGLD